MPHSATGAGEAGGKGGGQPAGHTHVSGQVLLGEVRTGSHWLSGVRRRWWMPARSPPACRPSRPLQCSPGHRLRGAGKPDDDAGGSAHLGTQERGRVRKSLGLAGPVHPQIRNPGLCGPEENNGAPWVLFIFLVPGFCLNIYFWIRRLSAELKPTNQQQRVACPWLSTPRPARPGGGRVLCFLCLLLELILGVEISPVLIFFLFLYTNSEDPYLPLIFIHCIIRNDSILAR